MDRSGDPASVMTLSPAPIRKGSEVFPGATIKIYRLSLCS